MSDAIIRLNVESQAYDQKLQRAIQQMQRMEREVRRTGATFAVADKEEMDFIKSLGKMETKATSARGKIAEMSKAFTELSLQYRRMTEEEKNSPAGKALAASLDQLRARIKSSKSELASVEGQLTGVGDALKQLGNKMGIPMNLFTKMGPVLAAAGAAAKVAKDAFNANEAAVDQWGRAVQSAQSVYEGFLTALNTGDISGYLSRIDDIISAARKAYDELDRLGTMKTIQSPQMSRRQAENDRLRMMIMTRRYIAPLDGSAGISGMKNGELLSDTQVKQFEQDLRDGIQKIVSLIENEINQSTKAIEAEYSKQALKLGISLEDFKKGTSSMAELDKMIELGNKYYEFEKAHTISTTSQSITGSTTTYTRDNAVNPYAGYEKWNVFRVDGDAYKNLVQLIQQRDQQMIQAYSMQSQAYRTINRAEGISTRNGASSAAVATTAQALEPGTIKAQEAEVARLTELWKYAGDAVRDNYYKQLKLAEAYLEEMKKPLQEIHAQLTFDVQPIEVNIDTSSLSVAKNDAKTLENSWSAAAGAVSSIGSALQQIDDPTAKVAGIVAQAVANVAAGLGQMLATPQSTSQSWGWIALAASGTATMIATIAAIKSATSENHYANGGIVSGNSLSGDNVPAMLNSGEVVLNTAQTGRLASAMTQNPMGNLNLTATLSGETIRLALQNNALRRGGSRGEYAITNFR